MERLPCFFDQTYSLSAAATATVIVVIPLLVLTILCRLVLLLLCLLIPAVLCLLLLTVLALILLRHDRSPFLRTQAFFSGSLCAERKAAAGGIGFCRLVIECPKREKIYTAFQNSHSISFAVQCTALQSKTPTAVGMHHAASVHFQLPVSLRMVRHVVEHGK